MTEYDNTDRGALFRNDKKETDSHPDYNGSINVGGVDYWLAAWVKTSKAGKKFFSLSVKVKEVAPTAKIPEHLSPSAPFDDIEDLPF